ncbi:carboxypeptidase E-like [Hyalella azteca]|uniref:Carboxypeptidase E-like n=1 Tax=Hyalella azteca TaxID=294128 RepID=A0A8B7NU16_HYAAZ|nr:carboxypeptidase E-like [Hyalella azteca]
MTLDKRMWSLMFAWAFVVVPQAYGAAVKKSESAFELRHHNNMELQLELKAVEQRCPDIAHVYALDERSVRGFPLWVLELSDHPGTHEILEPEMKYVANMHGNEVVGRELLLALADDMCSKWRAQDEEVQRLINSTRIHILPSMNPDGWQTATQAGGSDYLIGRSNNHSVDLNRDFPDLDRVMYGNEARHLPHNNHLLDHLRRLDLHPEPETMAVMNWILTIPFVLSANLHGGDLVANYPYDASRSGAPQEYTASPDDATFRMLAHSYADNHPRMHDPHRRPCVRGDMTFGDDGGVTNGAAWYSVKGGMQDFNYLASNAMEITLELGCDKYPSQDRLAELWRENKKSLYEFMWQVHTGVSGLVRDGLTGLGLPQAVISVRNITKVNATHFRNEAILHDVTTAAAGDYWRLLTPGTYEVTASAEGYLPLTHVVTVANPRHAGAALRCDFALIPVTEDMLETLQQDVAYDDEYKDALEAAILDRLRRE